MSATVQVIDLIETESLDDAEAMWRAVCGFLATQPGFLSGELLNTFQSIHPKGDYKFTSCCQWESDAAWQAARQAARENPELALRLRSRKAVFTAFKAELADGCGYQGSRGALDTMVLVDVIRLDEAQMAGYAAMWGCANAYMRTKPGYVGASLYRTLDLGNPIKFINLAEWESTEVFFAALDTPEFMAIIGPYKDDFSLYLSSKRTQVASAALAEAK
ncbi:antibiotic biosynthesis monooxygenase [Azospirillum brasilense]|uniref:Antibiotic biosynthesis monooxygenase n=3 Tax=Azospirillum brasilense TaxID=192 RepID=A0A0N7I920_AZOBR|nr:MULTISPECIES: antibiotic biosynthesis monooxygenase family protein [Azospirillum]ALJ38867.1 hypothetical protein AMK58_25535 [Azospirillum brasilense]MDW7557096.1 antibiotic biosynthesis monooxygenase family protein [Azospirillum brasilense]MDW7596772.1 antibiotic biosynthesis monooxygenase family protein [Azospirillum brasilense]MDX5950745.1 antibiotic biosynthesis monooxygenase family protein [Azospirillum brasilense]QCO13553.1 antibiotic biosynthesis monooxygenase [Azospirillum brasilens